MRKIFATKKAKKGFTILELLVVVAIISILAVIATPQFLGAIDKSRVAGQIADLNGISKAVTMYNFDTSAFPLSVDATEAVPGGSITGASTTLNALLDNQDPDVDGTLTEVAGWNGPYMNTYPAQNRWSGALTYQVVPGTPNLGQAAAGLEAGQVVVELDGVTPAQIKNMKKAIDSIVIADTTANVTTGQLRVDMDSAADVDVNSGNAPTASAPVVYYVIH